MSISNQPDSLGVTHPPIIVHPRLRWDSIWGRSQQILSRLSRRHPVLYVEPPLFENSIESRYETRVVRACPDVTIVQMYFPVSRQHVSLWLEAEQRRLLRLAMNLALEGKFAGGVRWFLDPLSFNIFNSPSDTGVIVYDCHNEAAQVRDASYQTSMREAELLARADLVLTSSRALEREKSRFAHECHFVSGGVEAAHFGAAFEAQTPTAQDISQLAAPILGYFGTIDERLDFALLETIAAANPDWNLVLIGPIERLDEDEFPQRENIHFLGAREYSQLPEYAQSFDACLLPFLQTEATSFLLPTQTLEYLATGKPIIATALPELQADFAGALYLANTHDDFLKQCRAAFSHRDTPMLQSGLMRANENPWDKAVAQIQNHLDDAVLGNQIKVSARMPLRPMATNRKAFTL